MYRNVVYKIDNNWHGQIVLYGWDEDGNPTETIIPHKSHLYYETPDGTHTSMFGTKLKRKFFSSVIDRAKWIRNNPNTTIFESFKPEREFLLSYFEGQQEKDDFRQHKLRTQIIDIEIAVEDEFPEPDLAEYPINVLTVHDSHLDEYHVWVLKDDRWCDKDINFSDDWKDNILDIEGKEGNVKYDVKFYLFEDEGELLAHFLKWYCNNRPDVISGWNVEGFDMPYLINRMKLFLDDDVDMLSPVGQIRKIQRNQRGSAKEIQSYKLAGVSVLDLFLLYKHKFTVGSKPNYKLGDRAQDELGYGKMEYTGSFKEFYRGDFKRFVGYNIIDVILCVDMEERLGYLRLARTICNMGLCEYEAIVSSSPYIVGAVALQAHTMGKKIVTDRRLDIDNIDTSFTGAYVFPTQMNVYRNGITSLDLNSLYPNVMINLNISPETKIGKFIDDDGSNFKTLKFEGKSVTKKISYEDIEKLRDKVTISSNGVVYLNPNRQKGIIPAFLERFYKERSRIKRKGKTLENKVSNLKYAAKESGQELTSEQLHEIEELERQARSCDNIQHAYKIFLNSIYGQLGSRYFPMFDLDNAEAVTISSQRIIKDSARFVNEYMNERFGTDADYIVAGDTDSVIGETLIRTDRGIYKIEDLFEMFYDDGFVKIDQHGHELLDLKSRKSPDTLEVLSYNEETTKPELGDVKHLVRHRVSKKKYQITLKNDKEVITTEDHGCMVKRDGKLIRICPKYILVGDIMISLDENLNAIEQRVIEVTCLGNFEDEYVYDIEMATDPHTFFANDILVHNSLYVNIEPLVLETLGEKPKWGRNQVSKMCKLIDNDFVPLVNDNCTRITETEFFSPLTNIEFKRELLCSRAAFVAKKRYVAKVKNDEGVNVDKWKVTGVDIKKNELPAKIKDVLKHIIFSAIEEDWGTEKYMSELTNVWDEFVEIPVNDIAFIKGYNTEKTTDGFLRAAKGSGAHAKAALFYNQILDDLDLNHKYDKIRVGDSIRFAYVSKGNPYGIDVIGWPDSFPPEFEEIFEVNYRLMFEKVVMSPLKKFVLIYDWSRRHPDDEVMADIFDL
jgi:DNA polymerase elongation subunit (family B)